MMQIAVDYNAIRKAIANLVEVVTGLTCIYNEPEVPNEPRPPKPYVGFKFLSPGVKQGDDAATQVSGTTTWNRGGQRKLVTDFNFYGQTHEQSYIYAAGFQAALETEAVQAAFRASGIAVWLNGSIIDLSTLLNTGFEGRCHMSVDFGIASNITEDMGAIQTVNLSGQTESDQGLENDIVIQVLAP